MPEQETLFDMPQVTDAPTTEKQERENLPDLFTAFVKFGGGASVFNVGQAKVGFEKYQFTIRALNADNKTKESVVYYLDSDLAKAWAATYIANTHTVHFPKGIMAFGGSVKNGEVRARTFRLEPGSKSPGIIVQLTEGAGEKTAEGAIKMKGDPQHKVFFKLSLEQAIVLAVKILQHEPVAQ